MPAPSALSIDEFAALVAATLSDLDVCGQACVGDNGHINSSDGQLQERPPPLTSISVKRPPLLSWRRRKPTFDSWSTPTARFYGSTTDSLLDSPRHSIKYSDTGNTTTFGNYLNILNRKPRATRMSACEPTILAASMSTVDFGNCLSLGGGGCSSGSYAGTSSSSRNRVYNRNTGGAVSTAYTNANVTPTIPVFTLEVDEHASLRRSSDIPIDLEPTVMDLSSTLRLPRTPTPLFRKSVPDLRIQDLPRNHCQQQPESPRTPRKSFFSKLKKQLSSKTSTASDLHSPPPLRTTSVSKSSTARSDSSPTGLFKLHLSLPLTPLSLSTPASPNLFRSPSPLSPFRAISTSHKRESAPPTTTNVVLEMAPSSYSRSPNLSPIEPPDFRSGDEKKRRIYSLPYNYSPPHSDQDSYPSGPIENRLQNQLKQGESTEGNGRNRSNSILSLSDCLVGTSGKVGPRMNWMMGEPKGRKSDSSSKGSIKEHPGRSSQPFPTFSQPESDDVLSEPSRYSCESAPRSLKISLNTRNETINEPHDAISKANEFVFPVAPEPEPRSASLVQPPPTSKSRNRHEPEEELTSYAPFVPLVFQHERLQQKLQKSVPLASMPAEEIEKVACIKSVTLKPFPPRTTSLSSSIHIRQRTKSAPNAPHEKSKSKYHPATPPTPMLPPHVTSDPTTVRNQPGTSIPPSKKDKKVKRPTTAPAISTPSLAFPFKTHGEGVIPFPVAKGTEPIEEEDMDPERQRKSSKLKRLKPNKSLVSQSQSSASTRPAELLPSLQSTRNTNEHSDSHREGGSGSRTGSVGLGYSLSLSKHPYAQTRPSEGMLPTSKETDAKAETSRTSKASVTFVPSTTDGESRRLQSQSKTQRRFKVAQNLMPLSPTSPTSHSGSGSGSDVSTKSPVTPRSPLFWPTGAGIAAAVKSRIGLGNPGSTPTSGSEEGHISTERKAYRDSAINSDSINASVIGASDDASRIKKEYTPRHPYSRTYLTTSLLDTPLTKKNSQDLVDGQPSAIDDEPSSTKHRPSTQTISHHGVAPSKPPPVGPLPFLPNAVRGSERYQMGENLSGEVPPSPVPSEYTRAFSNPARKENDDDDDGDFNSHTFTAPSYAPSQSSESYGHDPEYEALLAANTRANVGELASMRNIGVGRRLMSGHPQPPSSCIDPTSMNEGKRKRVHSEATRHPGMGGEWTLFLGNDDTPPRREDIIADLRSVPMTGIKTLSGVRARTKSESALKSLGLGRPYGMKRAKSSNLAPGSSSTPLSSLPPVPRLVKQQILKSDDWTLSLPLLPPGGKDQVGLSTTEADLSGSISNTIPLIGGAKPSAEPECVVTDDEFNLDDGDDLTIAESQVSDAPFVLDIDSLDLEDDDSLLDFSISSADRAQNLDHLLFSVPRVVSKGSGMESAKWGEEVDEEIIKKKGRRLSDGFDGMAGVSVRVDVNEDGESVCILDGLSLNTEEVGNGSEEGCGLEGHEPADPDASDAMKENLARLDALSADLKRFNELLKEGISTTTTVGLKHARSCGLLPSQTEVKSEHLRVQQSLDTLRDTESTKPILGVSVKDRVKSWTERSVTLNGPPTIPISSQSSPPMPSMALKSRPPLPFAPSSPPSYSRPLGRSAALSIGPTAPAPGRSATGKAMTMAAQTKPSHVKVVPAISAAIPDGIVGSGLKVGGNGRVISLSCSSAAAPVASMQAGLLRVITNETKEKKVPAAVQQSKNDEESEGNGNGPVLESDTKRNSVSSFTSADSFFTSFSSPSPAQTPPPNKDRTSSRSRHGSSSPTPTAISPPGLRITTSSTTNSTRAHSPIDDVHTPSSSALHTPLASSFPTVPPLPSALSSLGEDLKTVSRMLAGSWLNKNKTTKKTDEQVSRHHANECVASRLSSASDMSVRTIVPEHQASRGSSDAPLHSTSEGERDNESTYSDSFYSARSSFEG